MTPPGARAGRARPSLPLVVLGFVIGLAQGTAAQHMVIPPPVMDAAGTPTGFFFDPSVVVSERYDTNLFLTPGDQAQDWFLRVTPGIEAGYRSRRVLLTSVVSFDGERYNQHSELDKVMARRNAGLDLSAQVSSRLTLRAIGRYVDTTTPSELNLLSGIVVGRAQAQRYEVQPSIDYRLSPRGSLKAGYSAALDQLEGFTSSLTQEASAEYRFTVTPRTFITTDYRIRTFDFEGPTMKPSHVVVLGMGHAFTPNALLTLRAGPRLSYASVGVPLVEPPGAGPDGDTTPDERSITPEWSASLRTQARRSEFEIMVARTQTTAIGQRMVIDTTMAGVALTSRPSSRVELRVAPSYYSDTVSTAHARVFRVSADVTIWMTGHVAIVSGYSGGYQDGNRMGATVAASLPTIRQHVVSVGVRASARRRVPAREPGIPASQRP